MKRNMNKVDSTIRIVIALAIAALFYFEVVSGTLAYVLLGIAAIFVVTAFVRFCPLYRLFGISTCSIEPKRKTS